MHNPSSTRRSPACGRREAIFIAVLGLLLIIVVGLIIVLWGFDASPRGGSARAWTMPPSGGGMVNPPGFEAVVDDVEVVYQPYFDLLKKAEDEQGDDAVGEEFSFSDLALNPHKYRGSRLNIRGRVLTLEAHRLKRGESELPGARPGEVFNPDNVYQAEVVVMKNNSVEEKYFLHTLRPPVHIVPGDEVAFSGFFYARHIGRILTLRTGEGQEGRRASVVAPLLVGRSLNPVGPREAKDGRAVVDLSEYDIEDGDAACSAAAVAAAAGRLKETAPDKREEFLDAAATYFDMVNLRHRYRGRLVRIRGEVVAVEKAERGGEIAGFRRLLVEMNKDDPFRHFYAVYLSPSAPGVDTGMTIEFAGVFTETIRVEGVRVANLEVPLLVAVDFRETADGGSGYSGTYKYLFILLIVLLCLAVLAAVLLILHVRRRRP